MQKNDIPLGLLSELIIEKKFRNHVRAVEHKKDILSLKSPGEMVLETWHFFHFLANFLGIFEFDDFTNFLHFFCAFLEVHQPL